MSDDLLEGAFVRLEKAISTFNNLDDGNVKQIEAFEDRVEQAGGGVEVWVGWSKLDEVSNRSWDLGYARVGKRWRVVVRQPDLQPAADADRIMRAVVRHNLWLLATRLAEEVEGVLPGDIDLQVPVLPNK